jgi:SAM-dependent methyltransferase
MIASITEPISPPYQRHGYRTPGRYDGLLAFAAKLGGCFREVKHWSVLDVGGADGWLGEMLVCRQYVCLDPVDPRWTLRIATRPFVCARAEALPFGPGRFDLVVSKQTLPHFADPAAACQEMRRVARHAVMIRQDWPKVAGGGYEPIGWPGHSRSRIDAPADILAALGAPQWSVAYDEADFTARRIR